MPEQGVVHGQIILFGGFLLLLLILYLKFGHFSVEYGFPLLAEGLFTDKLVVFDACLKLEHRRVTVSKLEIDFAHIPLEVGFVEIGEVLWYDFEELVADGFELGEVVLAVELEGTVHDAAVVEGCNDEGLRVFGVSYAGGSVRFILNAAHQKRSNQLYQVSFQFTVLYILSQITNLALTLG